MLARILFGCVKYVSALSQEGVALPKSLANLDSSPVEDGKLSVHDESVSQLCIAVTKIFVFSLFPRIFFVARRALDGSLELGLRLEFIAVQPADPFRHEFDHELMVILQRVDLRKTLFRHLRKVELVPMAVGAPDASVHRIL